MESNEGTKKQEQDPAEYLFQTTKYHDRHITVGNPDTNQVFFSKEIFGVSTCHLAAQSTVFREMLVESELADHSGKSTHITDVSPEVFKLMLRHIYGGQLPSDISRETAADLCLCADKYNIQPLVSRAAAYLVPTTAQQVFLALKTVLYINVPDLERHVVNVIQEHTDNIITNKEFLLLDPNCLEFITKQNKLKVTELELWRGLLRWVKNQTDDPAEMRQLLNKPLRHVRFLTLTRDEFVEEVMPSKVLSSEESVELMMASSSKTPLKINGLCTSQQKRVKEESPAGAPVSNSYCFYSNVDYICGIRYADGYTELKEYARSSSFSIRTFQYEIELQSFVCKAKRFTNLAEPLYNFRCDIQMFTLINGLINKQDYSTFYGQSVCSEEFTLILVKNNAHFLLKPASYYNLTLKFSIAHPVFTSHRPCSGHTKIIDTTYVEKKCKTAAWTDLISVKFNSPFHVQAIHFKY